MSGVGSAITGFAVPFIAVSVLNATPGQMAALVFAGQVPNLLFSLLAGTWVDRRQRRPLLIRTDLARAALLALIPLGMAGGFLSLPLLWAIAGASTTLTLIFTLASVAILPSVVPEDRIVDANAKLLLSESTVALVGSSFAGALVQLVSAPRAIILDIGSYLLSAFTLRTVQVKETAPVPGRGFRTIGAEIAEGVRALVATPVLLALAISMGIIVLGGAISQTVTMIFYLDRLGLNAATLGLFGTSAGLGAMAGSWLSSRVALAMSVGGAIVLAGFLESVSALAVPAAALVPYPVILLCGTSALAGMAYAILGVNQMSLRQRITPTRLLGRVTAARRCVIFLMAPAGAAIGGWVGSRSSVDHALVVAGLVTLAGAIYAWASPIRSAR